MLEIFTSLASTKMPVFWQLPIRELVICTQSVGEPSRSGKICTVFSLHISMSELVILNSHPVSMLRSILGVFQEQGEGVEELRHEVLLVVPAVDHPKAIGAVEDIGVVDEEGVGHAVPEHARAGRGIAVDADVVEVEHVAPRRGVGGIWAACPTRRRPTNSRARPAGRGRPCYRE